VNLLACDSKASALIAAFAPVSAANYLTPGGKEPACNPARTPIPMLEFHGWKDATILYDGGDNTRDDGVTSPIPEWIDDWVTRDGCFPSQNHTTKLCGKRKPPVTKYTWDCKGATNVVQHYNISNLKHDWPSINGNSETSRSTCFDATALIMEFFGQHQLP
jgi:poly(3-hydroxybutyrate) depolymerase